MAASEWPRPSKRSTASAAAGAKRRCAISATIECPSWSHAHAMPGETKDRTARKPAATAHDNRMGVVLIGCPAIPRWKPSLDTIKQRNLAVQPWDCDYPPRRFVPKRRQKQDRRKCRAIRAVAWIVQMSA